MVSILVSAALAVSSLAATPPAAAEAASLVDQATRGAGASCSPQGRSTARFHCVLPENEGSIDVRLVAGASGQAIAGCEDPRTHGTQGAYTRRCSFLDLRSARRTAASENSEERRTARILVDLGHFRNALCRRAARTRYFCDATFDEPGYLAGVNVDLVEDGRGYHFIRDCRITRLGPSGGGLYSCQHLSWDINHEEGTLEALETGEL